MGRDSQPECHRHGRGICREIKRHNSRLQERRGSTEGEIIVEKTFVDEDEVWEPQEFTERDRRRISEFVKRAR